MSVVPPEEPFPDDGRRQAAGDGGELGGGESNEPTPATRVFALLHEPTGPGPLPLNSTRPGPGPVLEPHGL